MKKTLIMKLRFFIILMTSSAFALQFLFQTIHKNFNIKNNFLVFSILIISLLSFWGLRHNIMSLKKKKYAGRLISSKKLTFSIIIILSTTVATYFISTLFAVSTIFSASIVCLISSFLLSTYEAEAFSGVCAGMIGAYLCGNWTVALLIGAVTSIIFVIFAPLFQEIGGRGGTIAYLANLFCIYFILDVHPEERLPIEEFFLLPSLLVIFVGAFSTYLLHKYKILSPTKATMLVTLIGTIILPESMLTLKTALFSGTLIGMSTTNRINNIQHLILVTFINYLLFVSSFSILDGIGGKLGFIGLLSYSASIGVFSIIDYTKNKLKDSGLLIKTY